MEKQLLRGLRTAYITIGINYMWLCPLDWGHSLPWTNFLCQCILRHVKAAGLHHTLQMPWTWWIGGQTTTATENRWQDFYSGGVCHFAISLSFPVWLLCCLHTLPHCCTLHPLYFIQPPACDHAALSAPSFLPPCSASQGLWMPPPDSKIQVRSSFLFLSF